MANHDKSEKASQQKLQKARREGKFATSREFSGAFQFGAFVCVLYSWTGGLFQNARQVLRLLLEQAFHKDLGIPEILFIVRVIAERLLWPALTAGAIVAATALAAHLAVTRFGFSLERLTPDIKRFNPIDKIRNIPKNGFPAVVQACGMLVVFSFVLYGIAKNNIQLFFFLPMAGPAAGITRIQEAMMTLLWRAVLLFAVFGAFDLFRQLKKYNTEMKMTKQEVRDEFKQNEGSPQIKMRIRRIQRDMRRKRMMSEIASATAVIVNPTHFAVALKYSHDDMSAPVVVAKGKNYLALRIKQRAIENHVPIVENPPLAQGLYKSVDVGQEIPPHLYRAVAEVLAYIHQMINARPIRRAS